MRKSLEMLQKKGVVVMATPGSNDLLVCWDDPAGDINNWSKREQEVMEEFQSYFWNYEFVEYIKYSNQGYDNIALFSRD